MRPHIYLFVTLFLAILLQNCIPDGAPSTTVETDDYDREVIEEMLAIAEENSINRLSLDWTFVKGVVRGRHEDLGFKIAVREFLRLLGDNHSHYISPDNDIIRFSTITCAKTFKMTDMSSDSIGYIRVVNFSGNEKEAVQFTLDIQNEIKRQDKEGILGWVVDLSDNPGGNMFPMVAGLGPILGDGDLGYFIDPEGEIRAWGYSENGSYIDDPSNKLVSLPIPYTLIYPHPKVAVIIDEQTISSGEATAISFVGRENTLLIGQPTCGLSTANAGFDLSNGGALGLTISKMADRNKKVYSQKITPEILSRNVVEIRQIITDWISE